MNQNKPDSKHACCDIRKKKFHKNPLEIITNKSTKNTRENMFSLESLFKMTHFVQIFYCYEWCWFYYTVWSTYSVRNDKSVLSYLQ